MGEEIVAACVRGDETEAAVAVVARDDALAASCGHVPRRRPCGRGRCRPLRRRLGLGALDQVHAAGLRALVATDHLVGDAVTLREPRQPLGQGPGVNEDVPGAGVGVDEAEALVLVVPSHRAVGTVRAVRGTGRSG